MPVVVFVLSLLMLLGGLTPHVGNGLIQNQLDQALNHPEKLTVKVYPSDPSFSLVAGTGSYMEIEAQRFEVANLPIEYLQVQVDRFQVDRKDKDISLGHPTRAVVHVHLTEAGLNKFLQTDRLKQMLEELKRSQNLASSLDAQISDLALELKNDKVILRGRAQTLGGFFTIPFELSGHFRLQTESQLFIYDADAVTTDRPISNDMLRSVLTQINPIIDLAKFNNKDMKLYFRELTVKEDRLELVGEVELNQIPKM